MRKSTSTYVYCLVGLVIGAVVGVLFARKKGSDLRKELIEKHENDGVTDSLLLLKDEYVAMLHNIAGVITETVQTEEVQEAVHKLSVLTKELLPRREHEEG